MATTAIERVRDFNAIRDIKSVDRSE